MKKIDCVRLRSWLIAGVVLLCSTAAHASLGDVLEGQDKGDTNTWKAGNLQDWQELDFVPCRVYITTGPFASKVFSISFPHITGSAPGFENLYNFVGSSNVVFLSGPTLSSPANADWSYSFTVGVTNSSLATIQFLARLAAGAHLPPGSSLKLTGSPASLGNLQIHKIAAGPGVPDLAIKKTGRASAPQGGIMTYTLAYTNQSDVSTAIGAQISDIIPPEFTVLTNTLGNNAHFAGDTIFWDLANVAAHAAGQISYQAQISLTVPAGVVLTNFSQILSSEDDANYADNSSSWYTTVTAGCINPPLTCVGDKSVECGFGWSFDTPIASDAAASNSIVVLNTVTNAACGNTFSATRTWEATDACGNLGQCTQTITLVDTTPPILVSATNRTVECDLAWEFGLPLVSDACDQTNMILTIAGTTTNNHCGATFTATRTWLATDACGNTNACSQTVEVVDTTPPAIYCSSNIVVECTGQPGTPVEFNITAIDACDPNVLVYSVPPSGTAFAFGTNTVHSFAVDSCGNTNACAFTVTVVDTTPPTIVCATNRTVECSAAWEFDLPLVSDACDPTNVVLTIAGTTTNSHCGATFTATRTWLAADSFGNTNSCSQTIEVVDITPPTLISATNRTVECSAAWDFDLPLVSDACDPTNVILTIADTTTNNHCGATFTATRIWLATDACGNTNSCSQTIDVVDTTPPVLVSATNRTVECDVAWEFDLPLVSDACDPTNVVLTIAGTTTNLHCGQTFTAIRTWLATDACGNTNSCSQTIEVVDATPPILVSATNRTVECSAAWEFDLPLVSDACDPTNVVLTIAGTTTNSHCGATFTATRTWLATDACGNTNSCSQTIDVVDTTPPTLVSATNRTVECDVAWEFDLPLVSDACDPTNVVLTIADTTTNNHCGATLTATRTWLATDACGNTNSCSQTVDVVDTTPPVLVSATNRTVECSAAWEFDLPLVSDACDPTNVVLTIAGTTTNNHCGATFTATRIWLATDACGNTNSCIQTIDVVDTTPPTLVSATNRTVECSATWEFDLPLVSDCDPTNVILTIVSTTTNNHCGTTFTAMRTWLATDACGNTNSCSQTVAVVDTTPPVIICPSNIVVECIGPAGTPVEFTITASDACDTNVLIYSIPPSGTAFTVGTNTVYSFAVDACGNTNTYTFTVAVVDTTPPTIVCPADITAAESPRDSGSAPVTYPAPEVGDICDGSLAPVTYPPSGFAFPVGTNTVTALVTDDSGNSNSCSFTVRVIPYRLYVTNVADAGPGTLRQALLDANDAPGENLVLFSLPGVGVHTITLAGPLPEITSPIIINGWSQPGYLDKPLIEVTGSSLPAPTNGIVISAGASTVRGLILNGFDTALRLTGNGTNVIQGNFIGADATGTNVVGNTGDGIYIACARNLIGGTTNLSGNVIAGNDGSGVHFDGAAANLNVVPGNFIGIGADGVTPAGNGLDGIRLENGASKNSFGAPTPPGMNIIAFNGHNGITLTTNAGSQNSIFANLIHHNGGLGIDLGNDGPTPNDFNDTDTGPNQLQNFPVLTDARSDGGLVIEGTLNSTPNASYRLDFWLNNAPDPSTNGEGQFYLGSSTVVLDSSGTQDFTVNFAVSAVYTQFVTATAMDQSGNSSEFSRAVQVRTPPVLGAAPVGTNSPAGGTVTFCASASGTPPIYYQWRLNGQNIPGATNACYTLSSVQTTNGGTYSVVVYNSLGGLLTPPAPLVLTVSNAVAAADNFVDRVRLYGNSGETTGANLNATREPGEPQHAGKPGGKSVWYTWKSPETGIATIGTSGSDFDTLLGIYTGNKVTNLVVVASDEDGGGYFTSGVRFNVLEDQFYHFAIDGYAGDAGDFIFGWQFEHTERLLPVITTQPLSQTVAPGSNVTFTVAAVRQCKEGHAPCDNEDHYPHNHLPALTVQWFFEGSPMPGKTNYSLTITNVDVVNVGQYFASVTITYETDQDDHDRHDDAPFRTVESAAADLQINVSGFTTEVVKARDKLADALLETPWLIGTYSAIVSGNLTTSQPAVDSSVTVVSGYTGTQIFNTAGSTTSPAEDPICGVLGGASEWLTFVTADSGYLFLNTDGSSYDTVMAVFRRSPTNASVLQYVMCDNDSGANGRSSAMAVPVVAGQTNVLVVDGVNGAAGTLQLNYSLGSKISLSALTPVQGAAHLQITGWAGMKFSVQTSTNLTQWSAILSTNSTTAIYDFIDTVSPKTSPRFYRAKLLP